MKQFMGVLLVILLGYGFIQLPVWEQLFVSTNDDVASESADLANKVETSPQEFDSTARHYKLQATAIYKKEEVERLVYDITLDHNRVTMKQVKFSAQLHPKMFTELQTSHVFFSNIHDAPNFQTIEPYGSGEVKGLILSRAFVFHPDGISSIFHDIYRECYVKVTWTSEDNQIYHDYVKVQATPTQELLDVLAKHRH